MIEFIDGVSNADLDAVREALDGDADHKGIPLAEVKLLAPITRPIHDILCVGVNYKEHLEETKRWLEMKIFKKTAKVHLFSQSGQWRSSDRGADIVRWNCRDRIGKGVQDVTREGQGMWSSVAWLQR